MSNFFKGCVKFLHSICLNRGGHEGGKGWKNGRGDGWKGGRMFYNLSESRRARKRDRRMEEWKRGWVEGWKSGRWKGGRREEGKGGRGMEECFTICLNRGKRGGHGRGLKKAQSRMNVLQAWSWESLN